MAGEHRFRIYWDAPVFLDYVNGDLEKLPVLDALRDRASPRGDIEIVTSVLSITEVAFGHLDQTGRQFDPRIQATIDALWTDPILAPVECYAGIAFEARDLVRSARRAGTDLKPADAIQLATARRVSVTEFHTYDKALFQYSRLVGSPIIEPRTNVSSIPGG
ncbi:MAG: PIN domain-containing protein [Chloroflexota bacterium]|nr:PIN domain-containing protein [Chloroflexota bacterium]